mmetsp:Transcript_50365/g.133750  ORF Transcript_50365/g.133750 Transcript_50365/m.133750 type:complete len:231 (-) Transcript_50365:744-1436(-)
MSRSLRGTNDTRRESRTSMRGTRGAGAERCEAKCPLPRSSPDGCVGFQFPRLCSALGFLKNEHELRKFVLALPLQSHQSFFVGHIRSLLKTSLYIFARPYLMSFGVRFHCLLKLTHISMTARNTQVVERLGSVAVAVEPLPKLQPSLVNPQRLLVFALSLEALSNVLEYLSGQRCGNLVVSIGRSVVRHVQRFGRFFILSSVPPRDTKAVVRNGHLLAITVSVQRKSRFF